MHTRYNIVGSSASGKSTFAKQLSAATNIPYIELDALFWKPNWAMPSDEELFSKVENSLESDNWILDGNYTRTSPIKWKHVQVVIWLDYSFMRTLCQSLKRALSRAWTKEELWPGTGNRESFRLSFFSKDSVVLYSARNWSKFRKRYIEILEDPKFSHIKFVRLRSSKEAKHYLSEFTAKS